MAVESEEITKSLKWYIWEWYERLWWNKTVHAVLISSILWHFSNLYMYSFSWNILKHAQSALRNRCQEWKGSRGEMWKIKGKGTGVGGESYNAGLTLWREKEERLGYKEPQTAVWCRESFSQAKWEYLSQICSLEEFPIGLVPTVFSHWLVVPGESMAFVSQLCSQLPFFLKELWYMSMLIIPTKIYTKSKNVCLCVCTHIALYLVIFMSSYEV